MPVIPSIQKARDFSGTLGAGVDGYTVAYVHANGRFELVEPSSGATDHGELDGRGDDDHTQYLLADGTRAMTGPLEIAASAPSGSDGSLAIWSQSGGWRMKVATAGGGVNQNFVFAGGNEAVLSNFWTGAIVFPYTNGYHACAIGMEYLGYPQIVLESSGYVYLCCSSVLTGLSGSVPYGYSFRTHATNPVYTQYGRTAANPSREQVSLDSLWVNGTDATRKARYVWSVYDTAAREVMRGEANGSAPMVGFLGANAVLRQVIGTEATTEAEAVTLANAIRTALINLGLCSES